MKSAPTTRTYLKLHHLLLEIVIGLLGVLVAPEGHIPGIVVCEFAGDDFGAVVTLKQALKTKSIFITDLKATLGQLNQLICARISEGFVINVRRFTLIRHHVIEIITILHSTVNSPQLLPRLFLRESHAISQYNGCGSDELSFLPGRPARWTTLEEDEKNISSIKPVLGQFAAAQH